MHVAAAARMDPQQSSRPPAGRPLAAGAAFEEHLNSRPGHPARWLSGPVVWHTGLRPALRLETGDLVGSIVPRLLHGAVGPAPTDRGVHLHLLPDRPTRAPVRHLHLEVPPPAAVRVEPLVRAGRRWRRLGAVLVRQLVAVLLHRPAQLRLLDVLLPGLNGLEGKVEGAVLVDVHDLRWAPVVGILGGGLHPAAHRPRLCGPWEAQLLLHHLRLHHSRALHVVRAIAMHAHHPGLQEEAAAAPVHRHLVVCKPLVRVAHALRGRCGRGRCSRPLCWSNLSRSKFQVARREQRLQHCLGRGARHLDVGVGGYPLRHLRGRHDLGTGVRGSQSPDLLGLLVTLIIWLCSRRCVRRSLPRGGTTHPLAGPRAAHRQPEVPEAHGNALHGLRVLRQGMGQRATCRLLPREDLEHSCQSLWVQQAPAPEVLCHINRIEDKGPARLLAHGAEEEVLQACTRLWLVPPRAGSQAPASELEPLGQHCCRDALHGARPPSPRVGEAVQAP
mmetsp:Transcript_35010/g.108922  ORF Transcript_35010/g.108922 Transcript_35010/m.108922 type:complete len:501 (-) Transcript_35010:18-1520(-)